MLPLAILHLLLCSNVLLFFDANKDFFLKKKIYTVYTGTYIHIFTFFLQEASELSSLKPQLEELGVPLVAVVKENLAAEIQGFRPHFAGDIYIDEKVCR